MIVPEMFLLGVVREGLEELGSKPRHLQELFQWDTPNDISRLQLILNTPGKLNVILGFPPVGVKDTTIGLTLGEVDEDDQFIAEDAHVAGLQSIGGNFNVVFGQIAYGTMFDGHYRFTIYSGNADLAVRVSYLIKYILLLKRDYLQSAGLMEQHITIADFEPIPEYLPDIVFVRAILLKCKMLETFSDLEDEIEPVSVFSTESSCGDTMIEVPIS